ncbi:MAG TPA: glycosyltransferase [Patescibacteria group bacterium]|nr:glycosyltransferase [Patescibacteria group bacterium]
MCENKIPCSVPILTLNAEKHLEACLESVREFADVFLFDGNSTDRTRGIAENYGVPIYRQTETDELNVRISNFAVVRERSTMKARHEWVLFLDSDEFLTSGLVEEIREVIAGSPDKKTAYAFPCWQIIDGKKIHYSFNRNVYVRLYNRTGGIKWNPAKSVHEKLMIPKDIKIVELKNGFYNHIPDYQTCRRKDDFYLSLVEEKMGSGLRRGGGQERWRTLKSILLNLARAVLIVINSLCMYGWHGFKRTMPPLQVWRYVRYHLKIAKLRIKQFLNA